MGVLDIFKRNNQKQEVEERSYSDYVLNRGISNEGAVTGISAVFAAVELISNGIACLPIRVKHDMEVIDNHKVNALFQDALMTKFMLIKQLIYDALIWGAGYCYIVRDGQGNPTQLIYCEANQVTRYYNNQTHELYFMCSAVSHENILPKDMIYIYKNSRNGVEGKSIIEYAKKIFDLCKYTDSSASNFFQSGCNLNGILKVTGNPSQEEITKIRENWRALHSGTGSSGLAILKGNMDYQSVGINASDSQLLESRLFNVSEVARFFNIPPVLLGDLTHTAYNSIEQSQICFVTQTLLPFIALFEDEVSRKLLSKKEIAAGFTIDLDESYLLRTDKASLANYLKTLVDGGIISRNEGRKMLGLGPVDGGDKITVSFTDVNQNTIAETEENKEK